MCCFFSYFFPSRSCFCMKGTGWIAGRHLLFMRARAPSPTSSGEPTSSPGPTTWWAIRPLQRPCAKTFRRLSAVSIRGLKSTTSAPSSGSPMCCGTTPTWGLTCTPAACVGKTTPPSLLAGGRLSRLVALLLELFYHCIAVFCFCTYFSHYHYCSTPPGLCGQGAKPDRNERSAQPLRWNKYDSIWTFQK